VHIADIPRISPESVDPTVKNYHWLDLVMGLYAAYDAGRENVLLTDGAGNVTEGPGFNLFSVKDGRAITPARGVLHGVTRRTALELLAELGVPTEAAPLPVAALKAADEVFLTSTAGGPMPITRLDGEAVGDGRPGPVTAQVTALYWDKHQDPAWSTPVDYALKG
jgi:branched-chain amino acid aminotransferase